MDCAHAGEVCDLLAARHAGRGEDGASLSSACGRQELALANATRDFVMLARVAERSGHPTASGVEVDDRARRDAREQGAGGRLEAHRLLMAMSVEKNLRRARPQANLNASALPLALEMVFEQHARVGDDPCLALRLAPQERRCIFAHRREAAGFEKHDAAAV